MKQITKADNYNGRLQKPLHSGFTTASTAAEVIKGIDLRGKTVIVTGGYAGIGLETAKVLVNAGAEVWVPARDRAKAESNLAGISPVTISEVDLMDADSIDRFAAAFLAFFLCVQKAFWIHASFLVIEQHLQNACCGIKKEFLQQLQCP